MALNGNILPIDGKRGVYNNILIGENDLDNRLNLLECFLIRVGGLLSGVDF